MQTGERISFYEVSKDWLLPDFGLLNVLQLDLGHCLLFLLGNFDRLCSQIFCETAVGNHALLFLVVQL